jgi:hypothetical protein
MRLPAPAKRHAYSPQLSENKQLLKHLADWTVKPARACCKNLPGTPFDRKLATWKFGADRHYLRHLGQGDFSVHDTEGSLGDPWNEY